MADTLGDQPVNKVVFCKTDPAKRDSLLGGGVLGLLLGLILGLFRRSTLIRLSLKSEIVADGGRIGLLLLRHLLVELIASSLGRTGIRIAIVTNSRVHGLVELGSR